MDKAQTHISQYHTIKRHTHKECYNQKSCYQPGMVLQPFHPNTREVGVKIS